MTTASRFQMPDFRVPEIPEIKMPEFKMPEMPEMKLPKFIEDFEMPEFDLSVLEPVVEFARDAAYVAVGLAVMTTERLQTLQQNWIDGMNEQIRTTNDQVRTVVESLKDRFG